MEIDKRTLILLSQLTLIFEQIKNVMIMFYMNIFILSSIFFKKRINWHYSELEYFIEILEFSKYCQMTNTRNSEIRHQQDTFSTIVFVKDEEQFIQTQQQCFSYYNYIQIRIMKQKQNQAYQTFETSDSQSNYLQHIPSIFKYHSDFNTCLFNKCFPFQNFNNFTTTSQTNHQFTQRTSQNIVIKSQQVQQIPFEKKILNPQDKKSAELKKKVRKIPAQKESRNVLSNILRIFFKCLLQNRIYDALIQKIAERYNLTVNKQQFYKWVLNFNINFKNYIQQSQMKRLFGAGNSFENKKILMIVLGHYLNNYAVSHCLTSKKIQRESVSMHLQGLKQLQKKILELNRL